MLRRTSARRQRFHLVTAAAVMAVGGAAVACDRRIDTARTSGPGDAPRDTIVIDGTTPSCTACALTSAHVVTLGSSTDPETPRHLPAIVRDSRGYYYASGHGWSAASVLRYDSAGRYLGRLGGRGAGPGEYTMTFGLFVDAADSVYVVGQQRNLLVFGPGGEYVRSLRWEHAAQPIGLAPGGRGFYGAGSSSAALVDGREAYVHVLGLDATLRDSFVVFSARTHIPNTPVVGADGNLWTYHDNQYRIAVHRADGRTLRVLGVRTPSFPDPPLLTRAAADSSLDGIRAVFLTERPDRREALRRLIERRSLHIAVAHDGLLWVATRIPALAWERASVEFLRESDEAPGENLLAPDDESALRHTVVEVIDPWSGELLARTELPFGARLFAAGYLARPTSDASGHLRMEIHRVTLARR